MNWQLGLRNEEYFNISQLGLKYINLARNAFDDHFAEALSDQLETDLYMKCLSLKQNKITKKGIRHFANAIKDHPHLLSLDLRDNPGYNA